MSISTNIGWLTLLLQGPTACFMVLEELLRVFPSRRLLLCVDKLKIRRILVVRPLHHPLQLLRETSGTERQLSSGLWLTHRVVTD